jgi:SsrA-binding protein
LRHFATLLPSNGRGSLIEACIVNELCQSQENSKIRLEQPHFAVEFESLSIQTSIRNTFFGPKAVTTNKQSGKKGAAAATSNDKIITQNRKARHNYLVLETLECGIMLVGSEVKSLRIGRVSLDEAYARIKDDEVWLIGCDIAEYAEANRYNHVPKRPRKLLMHRREVKRFAHRAYEKGLTLVPLEMHFKRGLAKVVLGICRGKQKHDKREALKKADVQRDIRREMTHRRK